MLEVFGPGVEGSEVVSAFSAPGHVQLVGEEVDKTAAVWMQFILATRDEEKGTVFLEELVGRQHQVILERRKKRDLDTLRYDPATLVVSPPDASADTGVRPCLETWNGRTSRDDRPCIN
jgi:hypothetical protein